MPFTPNERELLLGVFRLTMAVSAHRVDDASREFSNLLTTYEEQIRILTTVEPHYNNDDHLSTISDSGTHASMPSLVRIYNPTHTPSATDSIGFKPPAEVELIITEPVVASAASAALAVQVDVPKRVTRENAVIESQEQSQEEQEQSDEQEEEVEEEEVEEEQEQEEEEQEEEQEEQEEEVEEEQEEQEEEVEEEQEEEEVEEEQEQEQEQEQELELVPVRIKKVTYWKDEKSGDIYEYLPGDEFGEKVGTYVDGKATFS